MHIGAQSLRDVAQTPDCDQLGWFVARQPGVLAFLDRRLDDRADAFAVCLVGAWRLFAAYRGDQGLPSPRLSSSILERAAYAVARESAGPVTYDGLATRQPDLCQFVSYFCQSPPRPMTESEGRLVAQVLLSIIYAIDEVSFGRPI